VPGKSGGSSVTGSFSIRNFLREREALLVHFSTLMSNHPDLVFPDDLRNAITLRDKPLSFSTIRADDVGPYQIPNMHPADANAAGSIGIIVDIPSDDCVITVGANDDGTSCNPQTGEIISGGFAPAPESCARSIDDRTASNEWLVRGFRSLAIFAFEPIWVRHPDGGEVPLERDLAFSQFPGCRIFSTLKGRFVEFDRGTRKWIPVVLGHFAFGRFAVYADLSPDNWTVDPVDHPLVGAILRGTDATAGTGDGALLPGDPTDYPIDQPEIEPV
jgi:hypothetical protein